MSKKTTRSAKIRRILGEQASTVMEVAAILGISVTAANVAMTVLTRQGQARVAGEWENPRAGKGVRTRKTVKLYELTVKGREKL
jgi:predicted ArsR family transcriptional regulator